jgi:uncharacterized protein YkwD
MFSARFRFTQGIAAYCLAWVLTACGGGGEEAPDTGATTARASTSDTSASRSDEGCGIPGFADQMLAEVNHVRTQGQQCGAQWHAAVSPLNWNPTLASAAIAHSDDMASHNFVSHTGSDGSSVADRAIASGYGKRSVGENLAGGQRSLGQAMRDLLASPAHCANLMRPTYTDFGAACARNDATVYKRHWTQVFGE